MSIYSTIQEPSRNEVITVNTTSTRVSDPRNSDNPRIVFKAQNISTTSTDKITISFGNTTAVLNAGEVLNVGDVMVDSSSEGYQCWQGTINAIAVNGTASNLSVFER